MEKLGELGLEEKETREQGQREYKEVGSRERVGWGGQVAGHCE